MRKDNLELLRSVQKNAEILAEHMEALKDKPGDRDFAKEISERALVFSKMENRVKETILKENEVPYKGNNFFDGQRKRKMSRETLIDISRGHIADLLIRENQNSMRSLWKAMKQYENASDFCMEFAKELSQEQEITIERIKTFL